MPVSLLEIGFSFNYTCFCTFCIQLGWFIVPKQSGQSTVSVAKLNMGFVRSGIKMSAIIVSIVLFRLYESNVLGYNGMVKCRMEAVYEYRVFPGKSEVSEIAC